ncbi:acetyl-CoA carboxylase, carboxyltransferase subunit beta [Chthonomonas calidirosea]|uniref:Acetyl-coenzyme A carboxylase carboxyl transferase subunit beta n=1 Tax=Chthonomonas calidirosea (strain DSM 23976 / ICMP 18418 / T49) TaxID=1303518 RepID=S0EV78_CHTCT|nr:acetyl-CoA carboxylase, carboxyltransferase subunit beta [Chthonomonas calidirosea]CCW35670.1 acetyl-CoA carboxylase carboxyltransferase subunit alpha [Chthonomonas calidirosea T49]CEK18572.1 acetyl-CoA carboxylase carboxyltransferase subunit alpha [Chthonomonas calidirosea]CEK19578.1 acetyl-CoA carboxylase carboxyltransferase subunit alpha [Chthonomonas calidirosea]
MARGSWFKRPSRNGLTGKEVPSGLWLKCPKCNEILFARDVERNLSVCPHCNYHHRLPARKRIEITVDEGSFEEFDEHLLSTDPLDFPGYREKLEQARKDTGLTDAVVCGYARIGGHRVVLSVADFSFLGGSMGSVVGEKIVRAIERAIQERLPVVVFTANGGGARMFEGLLSLMQMAKTSAAVARLGEAGLPFIVVLTDPTMAGVYASYASLGDITFAEPGALIGFAGRRVGNQDMGTRLPDDFQTSEFQFRCGMIDRIVPRREMRSALASVLSLLCEEPTACL